jgi:peptidyl-prolyl cis-trans isomerase C
VKTNTPVLLSTLVSSPTAPAPSQTPVPPTETPVPLAALVNGEAITMPEYEIELTLFQESATITGTNLASDPSAIVINDMIDQTLLAQSAVAKGYSVDNATLQSRIDALTSQLGGTQGLEDWKAAHGYTNDEFTRALRRSVEAAWMRDQVITSVPSTADEVHVLQILLPSEAEADQVYASLQSGKDFTDLAFTYDPTTGGDLGWFPRGYLNETALEDAAFALQPGQYSQVVKTDLGYHILYLVERDPNHSLLPDARQVLQVKALQAWLIDQRNHSQIQVFLP